MGDTMSTLAGSQAVQAVGIWGVFVVGCLFYFEIIDLKKFRGQRDLTSAERSQSQKDPKEKAKTQRLEGFKKAKKDTDKVAKPSAPTAPVPTASSSSKSDEGLNDRAFAQQFASVKQGTSINAPKKNEERRQKSVKQSRIRPLEESAEEDKVSAPSSNAGADADVSESPFASPEVQAADAGDVTDMLEPKAAGPSVLRLTDTDKVKQKVKKAKAPEKVETKKQRQNRQKVEAEKALREETEKERQVKLEAQRRLARISEGRPAKDGSAFMKSISQPEQSVWTGAKSNGINSTSTSSSVNGNSAPAPVQPLDVFDASSSRTEVPAPQPKTDSWKAPSISEEEQMELLRSEEAWSTVKTKKSSKPKKADNETGESANESEPTPAARTETRPSALKSEKSGGAKPSVKFSQQSSFAALSTNDQSDEVEQEWDV